MPRHDGGAEEDDTALLRVQSFGFPVAHDAGEEIVIRRAAFRDLGFAGVAIKADAGGADEDLRRLRGGIDRLDDAPGAEHAALADAALAGRGPESGHGFAGEMDEGVAALEIGRRVQGEAAHRAAGNGALGPAREGDDLVPAPQRQIDDAPSNEARGAGKPDIHVTGRTACAARNRESVRPDNRWASGAD